MMGAIKEWLQTEATLAVRSVTARVASSFINEKGENVMLLTIHHFRAA